MSTFSRMRHRIRIALLVIAVSGLAAYAQPAYVLQESIDTLQVSDPDTKMNGLSFIVNCGKGWPQLCRPSSNVSPAQKAKRSLATNLLNLYNQQVDVVLRVAFDGEPAGEPQVEQVSWVTRRASYKLADGQTATVTGTRLSPAVLLESPLSTISFLPGAGDKTKAAFSHIAYLSGGKAVVQPVAQLGKESKLLLDEPWVLAWFADKTPVKGFLSQHDPTHLGRNVPFRKMQDDMATRLDVPILFRLENRPDRIEDNGKGGLTMVFAGKVGKLAVMPVFGGKLFPAENKTELSNTGPVKLTAETEAWSKALPKDVLGQCQTWARVLRDYPVDVRESNSYDNKQDVLSIRQDFQFASFEDAWKSPAVRSAPVPPMLAIALRGNVPVTFWQDGKSVQPVDYALMDIAGRVMGIEGADSYEYRLAGLGKYLWYDPQRQTSPAAKELQEKLNRHVNVMLDSGHLAPLYFIHGYILDTRFSYFYYVGSPELAHALKMAYPHLSADLREKAKAYLKSEWTAYPPLQLSDKMFTEGNRREPYAIDWKDDFETPLPIPRESFYRQQSFFYDLYRINDYYSLLTDEKPTEGLEAKSKELADSMLSRQDWAIMGPVRLEGNPGAEVRFYHLNGSATYNGWTAGAIGLARLGQRFGWTSQQEQGCYLFGKLAMARVAQAHYMSEAYRAGLLRGPAEEDDRCMLHIDETVAILGRGALGRASYADQEFPPFIDLVEEVGLVLRDYAAAPCRQYLDLLDKEAPLWFISEAPKLSATEQRICPLYHLNGNVLAQNWILGKAGPAMERYVDTTRNKGDLFYIQNLSAAIDSFAEVEP